jgi:hypothetical protein
LAGVSVEITALEGDADEGTGGVPGSPSAIGASAASVNAMVATGGGSLIVLAANPNRKSFEIQNSGAVACALGFGAVAVFADDLLLNPGQSYSQGPDPFVYRGDVRAITGGGAGEVRVVEFV